MWTSNNIEKKILWLEQGSKGFLITAYNRWNETSQICWGELLIAKKATLRDGPTHNRFVVSDVSQADQYHNKQKQRDKAFKKQFKCTL